jgi:adenine-specific DNA-methyltransferase
MKNFLDTLINILKADERFFAEDGTFLRNRVYEASMAMDVGLIKLLLNNVDTKTRFFKEVDNVLVFDKQAFAWVVNNRQFLPDSYTRYKNRIGLTDSREDLISTSNDVVLSFPYKDCVLTGGQTKDDQKRSEVFFNATLAPEEVDRLLYPKVLVNAERHTANGVEENVEFNDTDNLIIKGNNLLAISSLLKRYEGKVKCIYIDPPYNTGKKNSFGYNDNFNHSTWLTFMKNRLEVARRLLSTEGVLLVQSDDKEQAYLKVLCDEVFGVEQFETSFFVQVRFANKTLAEDSALHKVVETIHVYSRNHSSFAINKIKQEYSIDKFCWEIKETDECETIQVGGKTVDIFKEGTYTIKQVPPDYDGLKETWATGSLIRQGGTAAEFLAKYLIERKSKDGLKVLYKVYNMGEDGLGHRYILGPQKSSAFRGKFYSGIPTAIKDGVKSGEYSKETPVPNLLYNFLAFEGEFGNCRNEGGVDIEGGKKPEQLLKFLLEYFSDDGDLILDFFVGSGSTLATAHKMKRQYIGVEQLNYDKNDCTIRLQNVIEGDKTGISAEVDWQNGGSFVCCELAMCNQFFIDELEQITTDKEIAELLEKILKTGFISSKINPKDIDPNAADFIELSLEDKKRFIMELLDMNMLYVNLCDLDDEEYAVNEIDKAFTRSFYGLEGE